MQVSAELPSDAKRSADAAATWGAGKVKEIEAFYRVRELQEQHRQAAEHAQKKATFWGWLTGQQRVAAEAAELARKNLESAQQRETEALRALARKGAAGIEAHGLAKDDRQEQGRLRATQEREQLKTRKQAQEKENAALCEAMASPAQAASLKASVNAKTPDQAAQLAQVRAKAEVYEQEQGPALDSDKEQVKAQVRAAFARSVPPRCCPGVVAKRSAQASNVLNVLNTRSKRSSVELIAGVSASSVPGFSKSHRAAPKWSNSATDAGISLKSASAFLTMRGVTLALIRLAVVTMLAVGGL